MSTLSKSRRLRRRFIWRLIALLLPLSLLASSLYPVDGIAPLAWALLIFLAIVIPIVAVDQAMSWIGTRRRASRYSVNGDNSAHVTARLDGGASRTGARYNESVTRAYDEVFDFPLTANGLSSEPSSEDYWAGVSGETAVAPEVGSRSHDGADKSPDAPCAVAELFDAPPLFDKLQSITNEDLLSAETERLDCHTLSADELNVLVSTLQMQKNRLRRLVVAQAAVLANEREVQDRSRLMMRDAMRAMHDTRAEQKQAERWVKRESVRRERIEQRYLECTDELQQALAQLHLDSDSHTDDNPELAGQGQSLAS